MLKIKFFFARSNTCISLVISRTTASDSVAFSRIRDIWPSKSWRHIQIIERMKRNVSLTDIISWINCIRPGSWSRFSSSRNESISRRSSRSLCASLILTTSIWPNEASTKSMSSRPDRCKGVFTCHRGRNCWGYQLGWSCCLGHRVDCHLKLLLGRECVVLTKWHPEVVRRS